MADIADIGNDYAEKVLADRLNARVRYEGESATDCEECGVEIPEARRMAVPGCKLCRDCKEIEDAVGGHRRG